MKLLAASYIQKANNEPETSRQSLSKALAYLEGMDEHGSRDAEVQRLLGWSYFMKGDMTKAEASYNKAINYSGNRNSDAYVGLGLISERSGDLVKASAQYQEALKIDANNAPAHLGMARYYTGSKPPKADKAIAEANLAISSENKSVQGAAYESLGSAYLLKRNYTKASEMYQKATEANPNQVNAYVLYANSLLSAYFSHARIQDFQPTIQKALAVTDQAIKVDPTYIYTYTFRYQLYFMSKDLAKAKATGEKIVSLVPDSKLLSEEQKKNMLLQYGSGLPTVKVTDIKVRTVPTTKAK
jgi:tetratricopeptide (TPR) repeat protein